LFSSGIRIRIGWRRKWSFLLNRAITDDKSAGARHETASNLLLAGALTDLPWDGQMSLPLDKNAVSVVADRMGRELGKQVSIVAIHPGTSRLEKRWPPERFGALCQQLSKSKDYRPVLIGGSEEIPSSREVSRKIDGSVCDWTGALSLKELSAFLAHPRVKTLVSSDSGPVHIASIHHKPVVAFYAKNLPGSDPVRWGPMTPNSVTFHQNMDEIRVDEVWRALEKILTS
jgi:ADP-heptose:LPS heptosyltransferase